MTIAAAVERAQKAERRVRKLEALLRDVQKRAYHQPNSDFYEYCADCRRSPHNVPPHSADCLVPRIAKALSDDAKGAHVRAAKGPWCVVCAKRLSIRRVTRCPWCRRVLCMDCTCPNQCARKAIANAAKEPGDA